MRNCPRTKGVVIDLEWDRDHAVPIFRFTDQTNKEFTVRASTGKTPVSSPNVGNEVDVLYDPENPHRAEIKGDARLNIIMFFGFSAFCLFFSIAALSVLLSAML